MKNKLFFLTFLILFTSISIEAQSQRGVRIGYIDMEFILENVPEYQEALTQLDGRVQRWRKDIEDQQKEIDQMKLNLSNEKVLLTKELIEERDEDIKLKEDKLFEYQQNRFGTNGDLMIQRRQLVQPIQDQVFTAVQEIAGNRQYDFIFDKSADVVMLYAAERNDISDQVIRIINRAARRTQVESKQDKKDIEARDATTVKQDERLTEREQALQARQAQREALIQERTRLRDSARAVRQTELDNRRAGALDNESGKSNQNTTSTEKSSDSNSEQPSREELQAQRRKAQDSIRNARVEELEERRNKILEERKQRQDSIKNTRKINPSPDFSDEGEQNKH